MSKSELEYQPEVIDLEHLYFKDINAQNRTLLSREEEYRLGRRIFWAHMVTRGLKRIQLTFDDYHPLYEKVSELLKRQKVEDFTDSEATQTDEDDTDLIGEEDKNVSKMKRKRISSFDRWFTGMLEREEKGSFAERFVLRGSKIVEKGIEARNTLIESNLKLVISAANSKKYKGYMPKSDLVQEGNIGLAKAAERFYYSSGFKFSTYAVWWIRQTIERGIQSNKRFIRFSVHGESLLSNVKRAEDIFAQQYQRMPTTTELCHVAGVTSEALSLLINLAEKPLSLENPLEGEDFDERRLEEVVAGEEEGVEEVVLRNEKIGRIRSALLQLDERTREVLILKFGLDGRRPLNLIEAGIELGFSRETIRLQEKKGIELLRKILSAEESDI